jgi:ribosome-associated protein
MTTSRRSPRPRRLLPDSGSAPGRRTKPSAKPKSKSTAHPAPAARPAKAPRGSELVALEKLVLRALEDLKAVNIKVLDVRGLTDVADTMIVASGTSDRHVRAIAESVIAQAKAAGRRPMGTEGAADGEWVLVDLQDVLVHVMLPRVREFYALEQLWEAPQAQRRRSAAAPSGRQGRTRA